MASTNKTQKMNLSQFSATDKPAWLSDYNNDMQRIDTAFDSITTNLTETFEQKLADLQNVLYPVGSYYMAAVNTNPADLFGFGEWTRVKGKMLVGVDEADTDFATAGKTGGEKKHTLTIAEMPYHNHPIAGGGYWLYSSTQHFIPSGTGQRGAANTGVEGEGGSQPHNNLPPYEAVYIWKRIA